MNFTETTPGTWFDETKQYRITLARITKRKNGEPLYYAGVLCEQAGKPEQQFWTCCGAMRPYKSMQAAITAIRKHRRLWISAIRASRRRLNREANLERIKSRGHLGQDRNRNYVFASLPVWVREKSPQSPERIIPGYKKLCRQTPKSGPKLPSAPSETSPSSVSLEQTSADRCNSVSPSSPASSASPEAGITTPTANATRATETGTGKGCRAKRAKAPASARKKCASKRIAKSSTVGTSRSRSSKRTSADASEPSPSSLNKKSKL